METKYGFKKMSSAQFEDYFSDLKLARTVLKVQLHHTYIPSYIHFDGSNHFALQNAMKGAHLNNGWNDIGQHISIFPDGMIVTGRNWETSPACIYGNNSEAICIENVGYFDIGQDEMTAEQKEAIVKVTAILCKKLNLLPDTNSIVYHHWFNMVTGERNNGAAHNKTCPGTNFFGGNAVEDCERYFIPLVKEKLNFDQPTETALLKYVWTTAGRLNIRSGPSTQYPVSSDRNPAEYGSVLRVYEEQNNWLKISNSSSHWVSGLYTKEARRARVLADVLNVRSGPGESYPKINKIAKNTVVYEYEHENGWSKIDLNSKWVSADYLKFGLMV